MSIRDWSTKDLENKWGRQLPQDTQRSLPWNVLNQLVSGLSDDTKLPVERLNDCIRNRDVSELFDIASNLDVTAYASADLLLQDRLVCELFSKFVFPDSPFNKKERAKLRFFEAEERCRETNFRVSRNLSLETDVNAVIHSAQRHIQRILGGFNVSKMLMLCRFGPGSSLCVRGPFTTEYFKLCEKRPTISSKARPYAEALLAYDHKWRGYLLGIHPFDIVGPFSDLKGSEKVVLSVVNHNKVAFVPKSAKTERSIAIEPYFNIYFQLGVGGMIRERLYRCGINLDSQLRNQTLAKIGSITGDLATIDFSMASDTISKETVRLLLPPEWFDHLDRLRSETYDLDGVNRPYHKFSSMGNGYTFELETLIFYALALAVSEIQGASSENISVFGDDVILPSACCELYEKACNYLGFVINEDKSFSSGPFRESCGEDFLRGHRVRPVFCKELSTIQQVASLSNRLLELNRSVGFGSRVNDMLHNAVGLLRSHIPRDVRRLVVGPPSEDVDGYIHEDFEIISRSPLVRWNRNLYCWEHPTIRFRPRELKRQDDAAALWIGWSTAIRRSPIPKPKSIVEGLLTLRSRSSDLTDFIREAVPRSITGRKIGRLSLGRSLVWDIGRS